MKKSGIFLILIALLLTFCVTAVACRRNGTVDSVSVAQITEVRMGTTPTLTASVTGNARDKSVTWALLDGAEIISLTPSGQVTPLALGNARVRATSNADPSKYGEGTVRVVSADGQQFVESVSISPSPLSLVVNTTHTLTATVAGTAEDKSVRFTLRSGSEFIEIDETSGTVTALRVTPVGVQAVVRATANADTAKYAECLVTVTAQFVPVASIEIQGGAARTVEVGEQIGLYANVFPSTATTRALNWQVLAGTDLVSVAADTGVVSGIKIGQGAVIIARSTDGSNVSSNLVEINVIDNYVPVSAVVFSDPDNRHFIRGGVGQTALSDVLRADIIPSSASARNLYWTMQGDSQVASLETDTGIVTAGTRSGDVSIQAHVDCARRGTVSSIPVRVFVEVVLAAETVSIIPPQGTTDNMVTLAPGDTLQLHHLLTPFNAPDDSVRFSTLNSAVATVSATGLVTALAGGYTEIIVTANANPAASDSIRIRVHAAVAAAQIEIESVSGGTDGISLQIGVNHAHPTQTLTAQLRVKEILPSDADIALNSEVTWHSSNEAVATVSSNGLVTAVSGGTAQIYARGADGSAVTSNEIQITVAHIVRVSGVSVSLNRASVAVGDEAVLSAVINPFGASEQGYIWTVLSGGQRISITADTDDAPFTFTAAEVGTVTVRLTSKDRTAANAEITALFTFTIEAAAEEDASAIWLESGDGRVTQSTESLTLTLGEQLNLTPRTTPALTYGVIRYHSSNPDVAAFNDGRLTAAGIGVSGPATAVITVFISLYGGTELSGTPITVTVNPIFVSSITVTPASSIASRIILIANGRDARTQQALTAAINADATIKTLLWEITSDGANAVSLNQNGVVTVNSGLNAGNYAVSIRVSATDGSGVTAMVYVRVQVYTLVETITLSDANGDLGASLELNFASNAPRPTVQLYSRLTPTSPAPDIATLIWRTSDAAVFTVSSNGVITVVDAGTALLTVTAVDRAEGENAFATLVINVTQTVTVWALTIQNPAVSLFVGDIEVGEDEEELSVFITPFAPADPRVEWTILQANGQPFAQGAEIAEIELRGDKVYVRALRGGAGLIRVTALDGGGAVDEIALSVTQVTLISQITPAKPEISLQLNGDNPHTFEIIVWTVNAGADASKVEFTSDNPSVVEVSAALGVVSAVSSGTAIITITATDRVTGTPVTATVTVHVLVLANRVAIVPQGPISLIIGGQETQSLSAQAYAGQVLASNSAVSFSIVSGTSATVSQDGLVMAVANGTTVIRATALDGSGVFADITINVTTATGGIILRFPPDSNNKGGENNPVYINDANKTAQIQLNGHSQGLADVSWTYEKSDGAGGWISVDIGQVGSDFMFNEATLVFTAVYNGVYRLTATAQFGGATDSIIVHVSTRVTALTVTGGNNLTGTNLTVEAGRSVTLSAVVAPNTGAATGVSQAVTWQTVSGAPQFFTLNEIGRVAGIAVGTGSLRVTSVQDTSFSVTISVTVIPMVGPPPVDPPPNAVHVGTWEDFLREVKIDQSIYLTDDITMPADAAVWTSSTTLSGGRIFEGNHRKLINFRLDGGTNDNGLYRTVGSGGKQAANIARVQNLTFVTPTVTAGGGNRVGLVAGDLPNNQRLAWIRNVHIEGGVFHLSDGEHNGGFIGRLNNRAEAVIDDSSIKGTVFQASGGGRAGGMVGSLTDAGMLWSSNCIIDITVNYTNSNLHRFGGAVGVLGGDRIIVEFENLDAKVAFTGSQAGDMTGGLFGSISHNFTGTDGAVMQQSALDIIRPGQTRNQNSRLTVQAYIDITATGNSFNRDNAGGFLGNRENSNSGTASVVTLTGAVYMQRQAQFLLGGGSALNTWTGITFNTSGVTWAAARP
ncbi:MAG: Ig-like domain-containing protein [Firmicutes bacterium]|nr:Ig-like domain-containing protein [Bacillota bacterium]